MFQAFERKLNDKKKEGGVFEINALHKTSVYFM